MSCFFFFFCLLDDKDGLKKEAIAILTERKLGSTKTCRRQLVMPTDGNAETSSAKADQSGEDLPITADENCPQQSSNKRALTVVEVTLSKFFFKLRFQTDIDSFNLQF